ncbi:alpha-hydroxy-acid oxidizing protein [Paraburkholderia sp. J12]
MYAAAIAGQRGVEHAIALLRDEIDRNMAMIGATSIEEIDFDIRV